MNNKSQSFLNIKVLRAFSCIVVMLVHLGQRMELEGAVRLLTDFGANGVFFFFCISGFLGYVSLERDNSAVSFWKRKIIRILPLVYVILIYGFIYHVFFLRELPADNLHLYWLRYFLLINMFIPAEGYWLNLYAMWTIFVFAFFYLIAPILFKYINSYKRSWAFTCILIWINIMNGGEAGIGFFWPIGFLYAFFLGITIYYAIKEEKKANFFFVAGILWIICETMNYNTVMCTIVFSFVMLGSFCFRTNSTCINKVISILDRYSYGLYLCHAVVMEWIDTYNQPGGGR